MLFNIVSIIVTNGNVDQSIYSTTKGVVISFTKEWNFNYKGRK